MRNSSLSKGTVRGNCIYIYIYISNIYIYIYMYKDSSVTMLIPSPELPDPNMTSFVRLRTQDPGLKADSGCITILGGSWVVISGVMGFL